MDIIYDEHFSIRPDRVSKVVRMRKTLLSSSGLPCTPAEKLKEMLLSQVKKSPNASASAPVLVKKFHNFLISENSRRNLRDKINYLHAFSTPRTIKTYTNKQLYNFRCAFITLTLPAVQKTPTFEVSKNLLDPILQVLRQRLKMENYVWRLEFQKNGNVHYHLVTDTYVDYHFLLKQWNNILSKHGYIADYSQRMKSLGWSGYSKLFLSSKNNNKSKVYDQWRKGEASGWLEPNTVDVKNVTGGKSIGGYVSKYFSKPQGKVCSNSMDNEANSFALRLCFWSRSLSRVKTDSMPMSYYSANFIKLLESVPSVERVLFDYATVWYYSLLELPFSVKQFFVEFFEKEKELVSYFSAT